MNVFDADPSHHNTPPRRPGHRPRLRAAWASALCASLLAATACTPQPVPDKNEHAIPAENLSDWGTAPPTPTRSASKPSGADATSPLLPGAELGATPHASSGTAERFQNTLGFDSAPQGPAMDIREVRVASHGHFDRLVIEFVDPNVPGAQAGWFLRRTTEPAHFGSGRPVPFSGDEALLFNITPIPFPGDPQTGVMDRDKKFPVKMGSGLHYITDVQALGWNEGMEHFVIGLLDYDSEVTTSTLSNPPRIILDVSPKK